MTELVLDLDDPRCADDRHSGAKAARLSAARRQGLPVLPGVVVPVAASAPALEAGATALVTRGSGGARLAIMSHDAGHELVDALEGATAALPEPLIVRSSSTLERNGRWSGAFGSVNGVRRGELGQALASCWASVFRPDTLERLDAEGIGAGDVRFAVLVQPEIDADYGGTARVDGDGTIEVVGAEGPPGPLVAGWVAGVTAAVTEDGTVTGEDAVGLMGAAVVRAVADLTRVTAERLGDDSVEWAWHDGRAVLLQSRHAVRPATESTPSPPVPELSEPFAADLAGLVHRFGDPVAEELVLPWAVADPARGWIAPSGVEPLPMDRAREVAAELAARVWGLPAEQAVHEVARVFRELLGPHPAAALDRLHDLRPAPEPAAVGALLVTAAQQRPGHSRGPGRWEPFLHAVVTSRGDTVHGTSAGIGVGAGRLVIVQNPHDPPPVAPRSVIVTSRPVQAIAPLLWQAAGIVTTTGGPGAHLFEVAGSLGVPAVIAPALRERFAAVGDEGYLAAIDGSAGSVTLAPMGASVAAAVAGGAS